MTSTDDVEVCFRQIENRILSLFSSSKEQKIDLFCFPENSLYMRIREGEAVPPLEFSHPVFDSLKKLAVRVNGAIHLGSVPLLIQGTVFNSSVLISRDGQLESTYQKIHLFDIELDGQKPIRESDAYKHGQKPHVFSIGDWKFGETICYDVRFSELYSYYAREGVDVILVPSAFLVKTGQAHWEILLRARAIESQAYVLASAQGGSHQSTKGDAQRSTWGHSMAIDPWGQVLGCVGDDNNSVVIELSKEKIKNVRKQIPMSTHRRLGLKS